MSEEVSIYGDEPTYIVEAPKTSIRIKVKKLRPDAVIPTKAYPTDAGFDLTAVWSGWSNTHKVFEYGFGLSFEIPRRVCRADIPPFFNLPQGFVSYKLRRSNRCPLQRRGHCQIQINDR